jgi:NADPH:quinone reductase-like Zn-dependent oxidoreductase
MCNQMAAANAGVLAKLAGLITSEKLDLEIANTYPLAQVRAAYEELEKHRTRGKIVLVP